MNINTFSNPHFRAVKDAVYESLWIELRTKFANNGRERIAVLSLWTITTLLLMLYSEMTDRELSIFCLGCWSPFIAYAFLMGFIHFMAGRDLLTIANRFGLTVNEIKEIAKTLWR